MSRYTDLLSIKATPQTEPVIGYDMVENNEGGFVFELNDRKRLDRFLILGSDSNTYYQTAKSLTLENATNILNMIKGGDGKYIVERTCEVSEQGLAYRNSPAIFVMALVAKHGTAEDRTLAYANLGRVCRTMSHLQEFTSNVLELGGTGAGTRRAIARKLLSWNAKNLLFQSQKYKQRNGVAAADLVNLSHPHVNMKDANGQLLVPTSQHDEMNAVIRTVLAKEGAIEQLAERDTDAGRMARAVIALRDATTEDQAVDILVGNRLPMEMVPTNLRGPQVYEVMLKNYGMTALLRNLGNLSKHGVLAQGKWNAIEIVRERLLNEEALRKGRVHPFQVLVASHIYGQGRSGRGQGTWDVVQDVADILNDTFHLSFKTAEPTGKIYMLALDVSSSMGWPSSEIASIPGMTARVAAAAMLMATYKIEQKVIPVAFSHGLTQMPGISRQKTLEGVMRYVSSISMGGTDCSLPMVHAARNKLEVDTFVVYTDNETGHGSIHPFQALENYRQTMGRDAKLVVVGMASHGFTIANPNDSGMLDVVGFSADAPNVIGQFARGLI